MKFNTSLFFRTAFFLAGSGLLWAGPVSLTDNEISRLRSMAQTSKDPPSWIPLLEKQAQEALAFSPHPIEQIQTAGQLRGSQEKEKTQEALKDMPRMRSLALAYALTGREDYALKAGDYVLAWARICQPPTNAINATNLEFLFETYDLIHAHMTPPDQRRVEDWIRLVAQTLRDSDNPRSGTYWNNHQTHRLKIIAMAAFVLKDQDLEKQTLENLKSLMERNLNPDGTTLDFLERDALHYQVYDLEPFIRSAILYQRGMNMDLYDWKTSRGASVRQCVAFVIPFAKGEKTHPEFVHSSVQFDFQRARNNEKAYTIGADFSPKQAIKCLELAQFYQPDLKSLLGSLTGGSESAYPTLQVLLNEVLRTSVSPSTPP